MSLSEMLEAARIALGKRKEREHEPGKPSRACAAGNKLLAGHLAHEFLAHGTLLGHQIEPSRAESAQAPAPALTARAEPDPKRRYVEVSYLLMTSGGHIPGVVNPTQLGRWLQIKD